MSILYLYLWVSFLLVLKPFLDNLWFILVCSFYSFYKVDQRQKSIGRNKQKHGGISLELFFSYMNFKNMALCHTLDDNVVSHVVWVNNADTVIHVYWN